MLNSPDCIATVGCFCTDPPDMFFNQFAQPRSQHYAVIGNENPSQLKASFQSKLSFFLALVNRGYRCNGLVKFPYLTRSGPSKRLTLHGTRLLSFVVRQVGGIPKRTKCPELDSFPSKRTVFLNWMSLLEHLLCPICPIVWFRSRLRPSADLFASCKKGDNV